MSSVLPIAALGQPIPGSAANSHTGFRLGQALGGSEVGTESTVFCGLM